MNNIDRESPRTSAGQVENCNTGTWGSGKMTEVIDRGAYWVK